jgi:hypothetical protein
METPQPVSQLQVSLSPSIVRVTGDPRWVETLRLSGSDRDYVFELQDVLAAGATLRTSWTLSPTLNLQSYFQVFVATVKYGAMFHHLASGDRPN